MNRWQKFYEAQMRDPEIRQMVEDELAGLRIGVMVARLREGLQLTQTELAAMANMTASKISAIENQPRDLRLSTLVRLASAMDTALEINFVPKASCRHGVRAKDSDNADRTKAPRAGRGCRPSQA